MEWVPADRAEVVKVATPPLRVPVPSVVAPSKKVTVPVAGPEPDPGVTVAVKVTDWPVLEGFWLEVSAVVVERRFTVWLSAVEVLGLKLASPP